MSDYCWDCNLELFDNGPDNGLAGLCEEGKTVEAVCEGCGWIMVDSKGKAVGETLREHMQRMDALVDYVMEEEVHSSATRAASPLENKTTLEKVLSWSAVAINLLGSVLCAVENIWCWPVFIAANGILFVYFNLRRDFALTFLNVCYLVINAYAWWKWLQ